MRLLHLHLDDVVFDDDGKRLDGYVGRKRLGLSGPKIEQGSVPRALDGALLEVDLALGQRAVVVRAAILDGEIVAIAVEDADLGVLPFDDLASTRREVGDGAHVDQFWGHVRCGTKSVLDGLNCTGRAADPRRGAAWAPVASDRGGSCGSSARSRCRCGR